ncbi:MAG: PDZ domain-containing protein, partial [Candidatus Pacebacteria bacterium]|nr:PDZ domain-containing protein [Candidatus Paceibacterota bacterium]
MKKALTVLGSIIILGIALGVNGDQATDSAVFSPLFEVYQHIQDYFYNPEQINDQEALYGAIKGMVEQLDDPYSEFLSPEDYQDWEQSLRGEFSGIGIEITIKDDTLTIIAPLAGTPAEQAGVRAGDRILEIDGESTEDITLSTAARKIRGEEGTSVSLL